MPSILFAQNQKDISIGGTVSADFGRYSDRFEFTPNISRQILQKVYWGAGPSISYYSQEAYRYKYKENDESFDESKSRINTWYVGVSVFFRYYPFEKSKKITQNVYLQSSYEYLRGKSTYRDEDGKYKHTARSNTFFSGVGYKHALNEKVNVYCLLSFKLNNEKYSPYKNPIVQIGFDF